MSDDLLTLKSYIDTALKIECENKVIDKNDGICEFEYIQGKIDAYSQVNLWMHELGLFE